MMLISDRRALSCVSAALIISISTCCVLHSECSVSAFTPTSTPQRILAKKQQLQKTTLFDSSNTGDIALARDGDRLLNVAFSALDDRDKYETVLTGLCAKVIDGGAANSKNGLVDPIRLMEESNTNGITIGPRGVISLVDVSMTTLLCVAVCIAII